MSQGDLIRDLKGLLADAATAFKGTGNGDFVRHLDIAAADLGRLRPRTKLDSLTLVADQATYPAPIDILQPTITLWGDADRNRLDLWDDNYPGAVPLMRLVEGAGGKEIHLGPAPTATLVNQLGANFAFYYRAAHVVGATAPETSVSVADRYLLLIRAAAQSLLELAHRNVTKPVQLGQGVSMPSANGTPAALHTLLMRHFEEMAA